MLLEGSEHLDGGRGRAAALDDAEQVDARRVRGEGLREGEEDGAGLEARGGAPADPLGGGALAECGHLSGGGGSSQGASLNLVLLMTSF